MAATPAPGPTMEAQNVQSAGSNLGPAPAPGPSTGAPEVQSAEVNPGPAPTPGPSMRGRKVQAAGVNITTPVLSPRAMQELMKRNHKNFVSVKVDEEILFRLPRPLAMRFSAVWNAALKDITRTIVTVVLPLDPPAAPSPQATQAVPIAGREPAFPSLVPPPPPPPSGKTALKFIIQWMEAGGCEPRGIQAIPYPSDYRPALEKILAVASNLEINELVTRVKNDLGMRAPKPKKCPTCKKLEHPGKECQSCFHCGDYNHRIRDCPVRYEEFLEREARRARKAEWAKQREIAHQRWLEKEERRKKRGIATGELGVDDAGRTIPVRGPGTLTLGRTTSGP